jgi:nitrogen fixation protein NifU and related proteins
MSKVADISADELRDLYRELILDHAKKPRHFGKLDSATHSALGINPLCGDKLRLYLKLDDAGKICDAKFEGSGCAISVASASLLTDSVIGLDKSDALRRFEEVTGRLTGEQDNENEPADLGKLSALEGVRDYPARVKCATLAWHALRNAIDQRTSPARTE